MAKIKGYTRKDGTRVKGYTRKGKTARRKKGGKRGRKK